MTPRPDGVIDALERQAARRALGVPVVSTLSGPPPAGLRAWQLRYGRASLICDRAGPDDVCRRVTAARDLAGDAVAAWARWTGTAPERMKARLAAMTAADLDAFITAERPAGPPEAVALATQILRGSTVVPTLAALGGLVPESAWPALLLVPAPDLPVDGWLADALRTAAALVSGLPRWAVGVAAPADAVQRYGRAAPESKAAALLREGLSALPAPDAAAVERGLASAGVTPPAGAMEQVAERGGDAALVQSLAEAARAAEAVSPSDPASADRARSQAERLLFELLESEPRTAGLFELNGTLDFAFGNRPAEIDLLCRSLRVAVELDGAYWHLGDVEVYRRDRKKDWALQRRGFLVVRILAEDVVRDLRESLDTIVEAVALRRVGGPR